MLFRSTLAKSLAIGNPADGVYALQTARETQGLIEMVTDDEIVAGIHLLAQTEGVFAETAGGVTIAVLKKLVARGTIPREDITVAYITGNGLKTQEAVAGSLGEAVYIEPSLEKFQRRFRLK